MRILTAHVENFRGWSQALLLVEEKGAKAFVSQSWDWEDREGDLFVLGPNSDFRGSNFDVGDTLVAFTDGISEAENPAGDMYGEKRIAELVREHRSDPPETVYTRLIADLDRFRADTPIEDDVTIFIARGLS